MTVINFDPREVKPNNGFEPVPAGTYRAEVVASKMENKDYGQSLSITHKILEEPYEGRKVFTHLCYTHHDKETQDIARGRLSALCAAIGKDSKAMLDTEEMHEIPHAIKVKVTPESKNKTTGQVYGAKNEITSFHTLAGELSQSVQNDMPDFLK